MKFYQIDHMQDLSGVLERKKLVEHLRENEFECKTPANTPKKVAFSTTQTA